MGSQTLGVTWTRVNNQAQGTMTSSSAELTGTIRSFNGNCASERCVVTATFEGDDYQSTTVLLRVDGDLGTFYSPTGVERNIIEAMVLSRASQNAALRYACAASGKVRYDPVGTTTISVNALSSVGDCVGEAVTDSFTLPVR